MATQTTNKLPTASVPPQKVELNIKDNKKTANVKVKSTVINVQENTWTQGPENPAPNDSGKGKMVLTVVIIVLKFCVLGLLIAAVGLEVRSLFYSYWGYDDYLYGGYEGRIYRSLWGYYEVGEEYLFSKHKEGNWQDWKKPFIKFQCLALALGLASTLIHAILIALTFVNPHKAVKIALLVAVTLLSIGSGGLVAKTVRDFHKTRPFLGFGTNAVLPGVELQTFTQEGYTQALASGATYLSAAFLSIVLIVLTAVRHAKEPTSVTPMKTSSED
ncbi:uncharacterized protein LOC132548319 [Ylistrum balloti]|uniref:uncharacterized protein LOC132548319 n=1 Tax=Ylistrum balloti TaxID=509963 RepID=UPI002905CCEC|nr:uncharacterized protein LOC132548319 [Ylistrum balloti]